MKLFNIFKKRGYVYHVVFQIPGGGVGDIEILSSTKLDSREKFKETRNIIAGNFDDCEESNVTILNVLLLRRMYK